MIGLLFLKGGRPGGCPLFVWVGAETGKGAGVGSGHRRLKPAEEKVCELLGISRETFLKGADDARHEADPSGAALNETGAGGHRRLTECERRVCTLLGITPEEFLAGEEPQ